MNKPRKTAADYMVIGISPALIMLLVGSLCFFLIEIFYRGKGAGVVDWVMFWFIIGIVLVSRIAIENTPQYAAVYGGCLALATLFYMMQTQPAFLLGVILLAIVWFCAHKLVWDCTLIDDDEDSSGQGLLQKAPAVPPPKPKEDPKTTKKPKPKRKPSQSPGRWVIYFSLAALPLFGVGQMLLPSAADGMRRNGFIFLTIYLAAALGLLVTTSFLGMRRYLRQRYLVMPGNIAVAWLKFGIGVAVLVLIVAIFLPRPGVNAAWAELRYQVDYQLQRASKMISPPNNLAGQGEGRPGDSAGGDQGKAPQQGQEQSTSSAPTQQKPGATPSPAPGRPNSPIPTPAPPNIYNLLRIAFIVLTLAVVAAWIYRNRFILTEIFRAIAAAIRQFIERFLALNLSRKKAGPAEPGIPTPKRSSFAQYHNPFFAAKDHMMSSEEIMIYTYEAVQVWAAEQGIPARPEETAREFCHRLGESTPELDTHLHALSRLYAYAAYGKNLPEGSDLEPIKELWRQFSTAHVHAAA